MSNADTLSPAEAVAQAKAAAGLHSFTLNGHTYDVTPHGGDGALWCIELAAMAGGALTRLVQGRLNDLLDMFGDESSEVRQIFESKGLDVEMIPFLRAVAKGLDTPDHELNLTGAAADIITVLRAVGHEGVRDLFKHTDA